VLVLATLTQLGPQAGAQRVGLRLQDPAGMVGTPGQGQDAAADSGDDAGRRGIDRQHDELAATAGDERRAAGASKVMKCA